MARIAFVGDIHGDIKGMYAYLNRWQERTGLKIDGVVHVGDFGVGLPPEYLQNSLLSTTDFPEYWNGVRNVPIPTVVCPGNHEEYAVLQWWLKQSDRIPNLILMRDGEVTEFFGIKIGAIWGNFSFKSWTNEGRIKTARLNHPQSPKAMHIVQSSVERLKNCGEFDVLITHDAPARLMRPMKPMPDNIKKQLGLDAGERAQGCHGFNELYETGKPKYHFFGHFHTFYVCQEKDPLVVCLHCFNYNQEQSVWVIEFDEHGAVTERVQNEIPLEIRE
jgi:predicted phosphodiesterase